MQFFGLYLKALMTLNKQLWFKFIMNIILNLIIRLNPDYSGIINCFSEFRFFFSLLLQPLPWLTCAHQTGWCSSWNIYFIVIIIVINNNYKSSRRKNTDILLLPSYILQQGCSRHVMCVREPPSCPLERYRACLLSISSLQSPSSHLVRYRAS